MTISYKENTELIIKNRNSARPEQFEAHEKTCKAGITSKLTHFFLLKMWFEAFTINKGVHSEVWLQSSCLLQYVPLLSTSSPVLTIRCSPPIPSAASSVSLPRKKTSEKSVDGGKTCRRDSEREETERRRAAVQYTSFNGYVARERQRKNEGEREGGGAGWEAERDGVWLPSNDW